MEDINFCFECCQTLNISGIKVAVVMYCYHSSHWLLCFKVELYFPNNLVDLCSKHMQWQIGSWLLVRIQEAQPKWLNWFWRHCPSELYMQILYVVLQIWLLEDIRRWEIISLLVSPWTKKWFYKTDVKYLLLNKNHVLLGFSIFIFPM